MKDKLVLSLLIIGLFTFTGCKNKNDVLKGTWKAALEDQKLYKFDDVDETGGKEEYLLNCAGKGYYDLTSKSGDLANSSYTIKNNVVTFYDEERKVLAICNINNNEIDCSKKSYYAYKYTKVED